ncbi:amine oxidase [flavin-containing] [Lates japonicus]|uniref:Amine oxidase [flavin-containing] n=1 Tax=Lates japonicus TaxID=270547 RepID=A0AAD3NGW3_LATJO|nr:amine oxidase [flavin-containing] [Lates japonicus]
MTEGQDNGCQADANCALSWQRSMKEMAVCCSTIGGRSLQGGGLAGAFNTDALLRAPCVQRRADTADPGRDTLHSTMTAPSNTYDVIVIGGGISGGCSIRKLYCALQGLMETNAEDKLIETKPPLRL